MDINRVVEIFDGKGDFGSGYAITFDRILTAYHVVNKAENFNNDRSSIILRPLAGIDKDCDWNISNSDSNKSRAKVVWHNKNLDLAVLKLLDVPTSPPHWSPPEIGTISITYYQNPYRCYGAGFPRANANSTQKDTHEIRGLVETLSDYKGGKLRINVTGSSPKNPEDWKGISGSSIFVDDALVGVVIETNVKVNNNLLMIALSEAMKDSGFKKAACISEEISVLDESSDLESHKMHNEINKIEILNILERIFPSQLEKLIFMLNAPNYIFAQNANQTEKALTLLQWAESPEGCGLEMIRTAIDSLFTRN